MKSLKSFLLLIVLLTSLSVWADGYNGFTNFCKIYYSNEMYDHPIYPELRRSPRIDSNSNTISSGFLYISFEVPLPDAVIVIQCNGEELYSENYSNIVCGDIFSYSLTEAGEYTTFVYVNGELVEEETILVNA